MVEPKTSELLLGSRPWLNRNLLNCWALNEGGVAAVVVTSHYLRVSWRLSAVMSVST